MEVITPNSTPEENKAPLEKLPEPKPEQPKPVVDQNPVVIPAPHHEYTHDMQQSRMRFLAIVIIISLIFGVVGGAAGSWYFLRSGAGQNLIYGKGGPTVSQNVTLTENSAIIETVQKDSPAVVSIIVSQDLSQVQGYGSGNDPFGFFFGSGGQSSGNSNQNNSNNNSSSNNQQNSSNLQEVAAGSGFFVSADGLILTNKHVVSDPGASYTVITSDGKTYDAKVVAQSPNEDLALVKISITGAPYLTFANSTGIQIGEQVIAIGNSLGQYQNTVTSGIISGIGRTITAGSDTGSSEDLSGVIQTDAAINPGNSGGPLLNLAGQVLGVNTAIDEQGQLVGFAIPSNTASNALSSYQKTGSITSPFLGVRYVMLNQSLATQNNLPETYGALIVRGNTVTDFAVQPGSPADKAGLVENDIILSVNGTTLNGDNTLSSVLQNFDPGDKISMQVYSKGKTQTVTVTLGEAPAQSQ